MVTFDGASQKGQDENLTHVLGLQFVNFTDLWGYRPVYKVYNHTYYMGVCSEFTPKKMWSGWMQKEQKAQ